MMLATFLPLLSSGFVAPLAPLAPGASSLACARRGGVVVAGPSPPPAIDLRFPNRKQPEAEGAASKYGHDPRDGLPADELAPDGSFAVAPPGDLGVMGSIGEFQTALDAAGGKQLVVLKFVRDGCLACASTAELYKSTAKEYGGQAQFYEVNFDNSKPFCRSAGVKFVPSGHIYKDGALTTALPLVSMEGARTKECVVSGPRPPRSAHALVCLHAIHDACVPHPMQPCQLAVYDDTPLSPRLSAALGALAQGKKGWDAFRDTLDSIRAEL